MMPVDVAPCPPGPRRADWSGRRERSLETLRALPWAPVLRSWLAARVVVLLALGLAQLLHAHDHDLRTEGLLGWDARWYDRIGTHGYAALPAESLRFFPLLPVLARLLSPVPFGTVGVALLLLANGAALVSGLLLHRLVTRTGFAVDVADRAVWAAALAPAAFVQVMGYTEPVYAVLLCGLLLALRDRRWLVVAALGAAAGALRPPGVVLCVVVLVEAVRGLRSAGTAELVRRAVAVAAPAAGLAAYLLWVRADFGDALLPFRVQTSSDLRGGAFVDPLPGVGLAARGLVTGHLDGSGLHVLWAALAVGLLVSLRRRVPASWLVLSGLTVLLGVTARSMTSFERYAGGAVPLLVAAAVLTGSSRVRSTTIVLAPLLLAAYATMAFLHLYVP